MHAAERELLEEVGLVGRATAYIGAWMDIYGEPEPDGALIHTVVSAYLVALEDPDAPAAPAARGGARGPLVRRWTRCRSGSRSSATPGRCWRPPWRWRPAAVRRAGPDRCPTAPGSYLVNSATSLIATWLWLPRLGDPHQVVAVPDAAGVAAGSSGSGARWRRAPTLTQPLVPVSNVFGLGVVLPRVDRDGVAGRGGVDHHRAGDHAGLGVDVQPDARLAEVVAVVGLGRPGGVAVAVDGQPDLVGMLVLGSRQRVRVVVMGAGVAQRDLMRGGLGGRLGELRRCRGGCAAPGTRSRRRSPRRPRAATATMTSGWRTRSGTRLWARDGSVLSTVVTSPVALPARAASSPSTSSRSAISSVSSA